MDTVAKSFLAEIERFLETAGLEPTTLGKQAPIQLTGMFRVDEKKIEHLNSSQLKNLVKKGVLGRIYAHLVSLENFAALLDRKSKAMA